MRPAETYKYNIISVNVTDTSDQDIAQFCNGWTAINKGTSLATVNGVTLNPSPGAGLSGESFGCQGNTGEVFRGTVRIVFEPGGINNVLFVQKYYMENQ